MLARRKPPTCEAMMLPLSCMSFGSSERSGSSTVSSTGSGLSSSSSSSIASVPKAGSVDPRLGLIRRLRSSDAARPGSVLSPSDLRFVRRLGSGDIGSVYLAEVKCGGGELGERVLVAAKVMDKKDVEGRSKWGRARTEREILEMVGGHPFLPMLYGVAENDRWSCLLTDFCPSGDLHLLCQRQPNRKEMLSLRMQLFFPRNAGSASPATRSPGHSGSYSRVPM